VKPGVPAAMAALSAAVISATVNMSSAWVMVWL